MTREEAEEIALRVNCGLCPAKPGEPCINTVNLLQRDWPHDNRIVRGRRVPS